MRNNKAGRLTGLPDALLADSVYCICSFVPKGKGSTDVECLLVLAENIIRAEEVCRAKLLIPTLTFIPGTKYVECARVSNTSHTPRVSMGGLVN